MNKIVKHSNYKGLRGFHFCLFHSGAFSETNGIFYPGQLRRYPASLVSFLHSFLCLQLPMWVTCRDPFDRELWACKKHCPFVPPSDIKKALCFETEGSCPWTLFGLSAHLIRLYDRIPVLGLQGELVIQELLDIERILLIRIGSQRIIGMLRQIIFL